MTLFLTLFWGIPMCIAVIIALRPRKDPCDEGIGDNWHGEGI